MDVVLDQVGKRFGEYWAVDRISLAVGDGEFFTLLGPSGCGKTTLLRLLAGFAVPDQGKILFGGECVDGVAPHRRGVGMVFQNYALFPQMSVFDNVAYGLRARKVARPEITQRVNKMLDNVQLAGFADRSPSQLSGGQQQRVALARALVIRPRLLLMDEPLSNLDAKLRLGMREEIRRIQKKLGITTIYVTHDQEEALAVSDRVAILNLGKLMQVGAPDEVYLRPANRFTAEFMGACNLLSLQVTGRDPATGTMRARVDGDPGETSLTIAADKAFTGDTVLVMLRPDWIEPVPGDESAAPASNSFAAEVISATFLGPLASYQVRAFGGRTLRLDVPDPGKRGLLREGENVRLGFAPDRPVIVAP